MCIRDSCQRRRDPCSAWLPSVCRPKTPCASGLRDKPGHLCAGSRRRSLPADQKSSQQTTPCVLAVRRPCPSIVPWSRRKIALWLFLVGCISHQYHGRDSRSTLLSASFVAPFYLSRACPLRTPACTSARHAAIAGSAPYHQRTADVAGGRVSHLDKFSERSNRIGIIGIPRWLNGHRKGFEQFALITRQEPEFEPPRDVVHKRLGVADLWISGPSAGLEAHVAEFFAKHAQWHAVLQGKRDHRCEGTHQPRDGRALLRHRDEDFSWQAVLVNSNCQVSLLPGDGKVMGECPPLVRQVPPNRARGFGTL